MNWTVAIGGAAILVGALVVRPIGEPPRQGMARRAGAGEIARAFEDGVPGAGPVTTVQGPPALLRRADPVSLGSGSPARASTPKADDEAVAIRDRMMVQFETALKLSPDQREYFARILGQRDAEISDYHARIREAKVFRVWEHEKRVREILLASQHRMRAGLSPEQSQKFGALYEEGGLVEGVSFEITPEMTVIR